MKIKKIHYCILSILVLLSSCELNKTGQDSAKQTTTDGSILPFPTPQSSSVAGETLQESSMTRRKVTNHLPEDAPNVLVVLIDDVGFGVAETFGGEVHTPTLTRLADEGLKYNSFHTTSICSPTRASLLTGRNHTRVGNGTIAERAVDWDGYTGVIPKTSATVAEVLKNYGYKTSAFGKWHNTPANETTSMGPHDRWPNGYGFQYFYGFMAGETSQYEPRLYENYNTVEPPHDEDYHLTEDMVDKATQWLQQHKSYSPDKPFFMYWAPGAVHGPHHVNKKWAEKYKGKFDNGWDEYRKRVHQRQIEMGVIPEGTKLTDRDETMTAWEDIPEDERKFQTRLMEVFAGFVEHTDTELGRLVENMDDMGYKDNTIIFYVFGDNGSSAEGQNGSISELLAQNMIPTTTKQQLAVLETLGGLDALGTAKTENMYHSGWAWAGSTPFKSTKLVAAHFGGTRNPLVVSWPKGIKPSKEMRSQFLHVNDIAPTIYDVLDITPPELVNGFEQDVIDGRSFVSTFKDANAKVDKPTQFFDNNGSRGVFHEGWFASTFGPFYPWVPGKAKGLDTWNSKEDVWQLYNLNEDFSQAVDLADQYPEKVEELKKLFLEEAKENKAFPIGAGTWLRTHPEDVITTPYSEWDFAQNSSRMPEFAAPGIGKKSNAISIDLETQKNSNGVLYALGGFGGGISCYLINDYIHFEYNALMVKRFKGKVPFKLKPGKHQVVVETLIKDNKPGGAATVNISVDGKLASSIQCVFTVPLAFSPSETFDVGLDLGSPVSEAYYNQRPYKFNGVINNVNVKYIK